METLKTPRKDRHIIDAVESLTFPNQDKKYNSDFKKWRNNKKNPYVYQFTKNTKEHIYIDGIGFVDEKPQLNEQEAFNKNMMLLGFVLSGIYVCSILIKFLYGLISGIFYENVSWNPSIGFVGLSDTHLAVIYSIIELIIPTAAAAVLIHFLKIPISVAFPLKSSDNSITGVSVPIILGIAVIANVCSFLYHKIISIFGIESDSITYFIPENNILFIITSLVYIVIGSIIYELLLHGVIMQSLRQFGDGFSLLSVSVIATCIPHNLSNICQLFIISTVIGYFVFRTGSLKTGIYMQIAYRLFMYTVFILKNSLTGEFYEPIIIWTNFLLLTVGAVAIFLTTRKNKSLLSLEFQKTFMSGKEKFFCSITTPSVLLWVVITFLWMIISIKIRL